MRTVKIFQVDAFTDQKFKGNPAGVVPEADMLADQEMQEIARELNNSETAFLLKGNDLEYDLHIRYFTPTAEVPVCGHATIAAIYVHALQHALPSCELRVKAQVGILPVAIHELQGDYEVVMEQAPPVFEEPLDRLITEAIIDALGIKRQSLAADSPIQIVSTGHSKVLIPVNEERKINELKPDLGELSRLSKEINCNGYFVFCITKMSPEYVTYGRMFAPAIGIAEDPVTGNANGPLGHHHLVKPDGATFQFTATQGNAMQRPGSMKVIVDIQDGKPSKIKIKGTAVIVFSTAIKLD
ncbi:PhzF family isomerase [Fulvivirga sp. 29W222]|uniref:PhzF family isomerase n=1 Tax=Fulvivirga marina TaxID=2494733 RepID=A0A937FVX8_9BACT|nr:PhzF family isomerase [Fulvivirga marina]MBL6446964.1 PhzF family isomerase [Fulvivirga marina]